MDLTCCIPKISAREALLHNNLMSDEGIKCKEKLLFLYNFLELQGCNLNLYPKVVSNVKAICGNSCCDTVVTTSLISTDLVVDIKISCDENIIAESFVIY
jgi:hypothetical protein